MIGLQELIIEQKIKITHLAMELGIRPARIWDWIKKNKVPKDCLSMLTDKFNVGEEYLNKVVNNINTYQPKKFGFCNEYIIEGNITKLILNRKKGDNLIALIDTEDLQRLKEYGRTWTASYRENIDNYYVSTNIRDNNPNTKSKYKSVLLHQFIAGMPDNCVVDHRNSQYTLDNRKENLRSTAYNNNSSNRKGANKNSKTSVRNVCYNGEKTEYWEQFMRKGERFKWIFPLDQFEEACKFAKIKRKEIFGEFAGEG